MLSGIRSITSESLYSYVPVAVSDRAERGKRLNRSFCRSDTKVSSPHHKAEVFYMVGAMIVVVTILKVIWQFCSYLFWPQLYYKAMEND